MRDPAITQTEATERTNALLDDLGAQRPAEKLAERVSRQAVNRYDQRLRAACERVLQSRQVFEVWADKLGSAPAGQFGHLVTEMMRATVFDLAFRLQDLEIDDETLPGVVQTAFKITLMAESLERSREIAARCDREIKRLAAKAAAAKTPSESKRAISPERLREIIRESYGA